MGVCYYHYTVICPKTRNQKQIRAPILQRHVWGPRLRYLEFANRLRIHACCTITTANILNRGNPQGSNKLDKQGSQITVKQAVNFGPLPLRPCDLWISQVPAKPAMEARDDTSDGEEEDDEIEDEEAHLCAPLWALATSSPSSNLKPLQINRTCRSSGSMSAYFRHQHST